MPEKFSNPAGLAAARVCGPRLPADCFRAPPPALWPGLGLLRDPPPFEPAAAFFPAAFLPAPVFLLARAICVLLDAGLCGPVGAKRRRGM
jgi:hypothetical protein